MQGYLCYSTTAEGSARGLERDLAYRQIANSDTPDDSRGRPGRGKEENLKSDELKSEVAPASLVHLKQLSERLASKPAWQRNQAT